jgi:hypothetical protein
MAYMNQDRKARIAPAVKAILKRYGVKGTLSTDRNSLSLNIKSGTLDFIGDYNSAPRPYYYDTSSRWESRGDIQVNNYHYGDHFASKVIKSFLREVLAALNDGNHDNSDIQSDYFDVGWYVHVNIGKWNKPYVLDK